MSRFWAITSFFNPAAYRRKRANYAIFRKHLEVPLVTVELSHTGEFELVEGDAEILVQIRGDVMWQKERLLNVAISRLPNECEYVAWLDCDVIFGRTGWESVAVRELEHVTLCQLYRAVYHLARDAAKIGRETATQRHDSIGYASASGIPISVGSVTDGIPGVFKRGHAWCARRELLASHEIYDRNVVGSGDRLLAHAAIGQAEEVIRRDGMIRGHAEDYRCWAARFRSAVEQIGYVDGDLFHLWHGDLEHRLYLQRLKILSSCHYDPASDIALDTDGGWRWSSQKPEMHRLVREYFEQREEDGDDASDPPHVPTLA